MATVVLRMPSGRDTRRGILSTLGAAIVEGLRNADRYQTLARKSDAELVELGVRREDLPRIAMFGKKKSDAASTLPSITPLRSSK